MTAISAEPSRLWGVATNLLGGVASKLFGFRETARAPEVPELFKPMFAVGRAVLGARDKADLSRKLDGAILPLRDAIRGIAAAAKVEDSSFDPERFRDETFEVSGSEPVTLALGMNAITKLMRGFAAFPPLARALYAAQRDQSPKGAIARRAFAVLPWSLHEGVVAPHVLVTSAIVQARGTVALFALFDAFVTGRKPDAWLTNALADEWLAAMAEAKRLAASTGYLASDDVEGLYDLPRLFADADEADARILEAAMNSEIGVLSEP